MLNRERTGTTDDPGEAGDFVEARAGDFAREREGAGGFTGVEGGLVGDFAAAGLAGAGLGADVVGDWSFLTTRARVFFWVVTRISINFKTFPSCMARSICSFAWVSSS